MEKTFSPTKKQLREFAEAYVYDNMEYDDEADAFIIPYGGMPYELPITGNITLGTGFDNLPYAIFTDRDGQPDEYRDLTPSDETLFADTVQTLLEEYTRENKAWLETARYLERIR